MASPALTGVSGVGYYASAGGSPTVAVTGSMTTTAGRGMVAVLVGQDATAASFSDSKGNTWANAGTVQLGNVSGFAVYAQIGYCASIATGGSGHTVTGTTTTDGYSTIVAFEVDQAIAFDAQAGADINASPWASSITTGVADTLAVAGIVFAGTSGWTLAASGWTWFGEVMAGQTADWDLGLLTRSVASAGATAISVTPTGGGTGSEATIKLASFKVAGGGGGVTCTLVVTDTADTVASTAQVAISASLARTDAADTLSAAAQALVLASLARTDAADTLASTAGIVITANASATDAPDTLSATATVGSAPVVCDLAVTDAADILVSTAPVLVGITLAATDASDVLAAAAGVQVVAALSASDQPDTLEAFAITGTLDEVVCTLSVTDEPDTLASTMEAEQRRGHGGRNAGFRFYDDFFAPPMQARVAVRDDEDRLDSRARVSWVQRVASARIVDGDDTLQASVEVVPWAPLNLMRTGPQLQRTGVWRPSPRRAKGTR